MPPKCERHACRNRVPRTKDGRGWRVYCSTECRLHVQKRQGAEPRQHRDFLCEQCGAGVTTNDPDVRDVCPDCTEGRAE